MKKLIVLLLMILPLGAIAQEVKIAFVKPQEVFMAIQKVGEEKGYTYIIDPAALLYTGTNAVDATPFVRTKLGL